jgi:hypothetical protein
MKSKSECEFIKEVFYDLLDEYNKGNRSKEIWDKMFLILMDIAISLCKKKAKGIKIPDLESKALDATIYSMDLIKRGKGPSRKLNSLYAWLNSQVIAELYNAKLQTVEREISLDVFTLESQEEMLQDSENGYIINIQEKRTNDK